MTHWSLRLFVVGSDARNYCDLSDQTHKQQASTCAARGWRQGHSTQCDTSTCRANHERK